MAPNTLGESMRGRQSHSMFPLGATSASDSQSDRKPYSAIGGNGECSQSGIDNVTPPAFHAVTVFDVPRADATVIDVGGQDVRITSPNQGFFSQRGETKVDLVQPYI